MPRQAAAQGVSAPDHGTTDESLRAGKKSLD
jgi:hypothetical protein